jgi:hypothetical protein
MTDKPSAANERRYDHAAPDGDVGPDAGVTPGDVAGGRSGDEVGGAHISEAAEDHLPTEEDILSERNDAFRAQMEQLPRASEEFARGEQGNIILVWRCLACGWCTAVETPGFAGDGYSHYPDGSTPCGPLVAVRK